MEPKRLYKATGRRMLCGVCGGIAEYFNIDPTLVRLIFAALFFAGTLGLWGYILAAIIIPEPLVE